MTLAELSGLKPTVVAPIASNDRSIPCRSMSRTSWWLPMEALSLRNCRGCLRKLMTGCSRASPGHGRSRYHSGLGDSAPQADWAIDALDRLRLLDLAAPLMAGRSPRPVHVPLAEATWPMLEEFGREMQAQQAIAGGLMRSAFGKARGLTLRLSLVLEMLWWSASEGMAAPPSVITEKAFLAAAMLVAEYFMPMAERV